MTNNSEDEFVAKSDDPFHLQFLFHNFERASPFLFNKVYFVPRENKELDNDFYSIEEVSRSGNFDVRVISRSSGRMLGRTFDGEVDLSVVICEAEKDG